MSVNQKKFLPTILALNTLGWKNMGEHIKIGTKMPWIIESVDATFGFGKSWNANGNQSRSQTQIRE